MNKKINIDLNLFKILYLHYRQIILPIIVIFVSFILLTKFVIPQIQGLLLISEEIKDANAKLAVMKNNLSVLNNLNDISLDKQLKVVNVALPSNKDFNGILSALAIASSRANVSLGNFSFRIGDLSSPQKDAGKYLSLKLDLNVTGDINSVANFINILSNSLPLSEITSIGANTKNSTLTVVFYYKPIFSIQYFDTATLPVISKKDLDLIEKISAFYNASL